MINIAKELVLWYWFQGLELKWKYNVIVFISEFSKNLIIIIIISLADLFLLLIFAVNLALGMLASNQVCSNWYNLSFKWFCLSSEHMV